MQQAKSTVNTLCHDSLSHSREYMVTSPCYVVQCTCATDVPQRENTNSSDFYSHSVATICEQTGKSNKREREKIDRWNELRDLFGDDRGVCNDA